MIWQVLLSSCGIQDRCKMVDFTQLKKCSSIFCAISKNEKKQNKDDIQLDNFS
jgi:hypothetical protein